MDEMVLKAQKWVNTTYSSVSGYIPCTENGKTGWETMFSLTRALQHELGITELSDSFGPTTMSKLTAYGPIGSASSNANMRAIVEAALYCKGYYGGNIDGTFYSTTTMGLVSLAEDMGFDSNLVIPGVPPKVVKALLNMDAYVILSGGTAAVRSVQQWLNTTYIGRANFFIIPCDGVFSRDVQKALYLAIQFSLGMTDDQATGVFGPGTRGGLRNNQLSIGSTGIFVRIFSAAMIFNQVTVSGKKYSTFTATFNSQLSAATKAFQEFTELPITGNGDFATWCELLVSTGDPDRPATACDCITTITDSRAKALVASGVRIIGRYLDERPSSKRLDKQIQPGELAVIFANGLRVFPISQYYGEEVGYFTYDQGYTDATDATHAAAAYRFDIGTVIYFAVDYDATQADIESNIIPYFRGIVAGLASGGKLYVHGVYGSRNVCAEVTRETYARWSFVSGMSTGFSGNMGFCLPENWSFNQIQTLTVGSGSGSIDIDKVVHRSGTDPGVSSVNNLSSPIEAYVAYIRRLYDLAVAYGGSRNPNQLVMEYLRSKDYNNLQWRAIIGEIDEAFIDYVKSTGLQEMKTFVDPYYGIDIHIAHFGATCHGHYKYGFPGGTKANLGDLCGWGGDLITFYVEWRQNHNSYASGYAYCQEKLGKVAVNSSFKLRDLIEDADAYNIAEQVRNGVTIADAIEKYFAFPGFRKRFTDFHTSRFAHDNREHTKAIAKELMAGAQDIVLAAARNNLVQLSSNGKVMLPGGLPDDLMDDFCAGFTKILLDHVTMEI